MCHIILQTWQERLGHTQSVPASFAFHYFYSFLEPCFLAPDLSRLTTSKQNNTLHSTHSHPSYLSSVFVFFFCLRPWLASYSFTARFSIKIFYSSLISPLPATCHILLALSTAVRFNIKCILRSSSLCHSFRPTVTLAENSMPVNYCWSNYKILSCVTNSALRNFSALAAIRTRLDTYIQKLWPQIVIPVNISS